MKAQVIMSLLGGFLLSCSSQLFEHMPKVKESQLSETKKDEDQKKATEDENEFQASEPVPIGGAYLICAYATTEPSSIGCRLEDKSRQKIQIKDARNDDVAALSSEGSHLTVHFQAAPVSSFWHWVSASELSGMVIAKVTLSKRFILTEEDGYVTEILDSYPDERPVLPDTPSETGATPIVSPPPSGGQITRIADNKVKAGDSFWYYGPDGQSCAETCVANGGFNQAITVEWSKSVGFCTNVMTRIFGLAISPVSDQTNDNQGLGCFTVQGSLPTVFTERSQAPVTPDSKKPGVRRLCSCLL
jgi:hypothetical protein